MAKNKIKISELVPDNKNYNKGTEFGETLMEKSLRTHGAGRSILLDKNLRIIAGNKTAQKAGELGIEDVQLVHSDGKRIIAVVRDDIDLDTEAGRELALADNAVSKVNLEWDEENLAKDFELEELQEWGIHLEVEELEPAEEPETPEVPEIPKTVLGDLYELVSIESGITHRVHCGDSCDSDVVGKTMGGEKVDLCFTDPPYGIKMDKGFSGSGGFGGKGKAIKRRQYDGDWDAERPNESIFQLIVNSNTDCIIFGGNFFTDLLPVGNHWIVWDKNNTMPTFGDCELAWTNIKRNSVKKYDFTYNGLIGKENERFHPTQKPLGLYDMILSDYSDIGNKIHDPFLGSGTTLIACEQLGRVCYGQELDEKYMDVIVKRWVNYMKDNGREYKVLRNGKECLDFDVTAE